MSDSLVSVSKRGRIAVITVDYPPVNALGAGVRDGLAAAIQQINGDGDVDAAVLIGTGRTFIAGADIREFGKPMTGTPLNDVNRAIETCAKPVVAAIHGTALGGGLEVALSCHYRVAVAKGLVGLPEVKLGILPGAGGTQRLPRLAGIKAALDMITTGKFVPAPKAKELGIVDEVVDGDLLDGAVAYAEDVVAKGAARPMARDLPVEADPAAFEAARKAIARSARGYLAPWKCIDAVEAAATSASFDEGLAREQALIQECFASPQSKAQIHTFFAEREVAKIPDVPADTPKLPIRKAAVIGAGTMGGGIAMNFANAGIPVTVLEVSPEVLDKGMATVRGNYQATVDKGRLPQATMDKRIGLISSTTEYADIADADVVIEAVFEEMDIKKQVFGKLGEVMKPDAMLASNTSTLDIDQMAQASGRPGQVIGMHFFSPANVMRLLEVVRGKDSSPQTIATAMGLGKAMGKVSALVGNCDGFVGNRMLHGYLREANFLIEEGASPQDVDRVVFDFGFPMGPFAMSDMAGLDVGWRVRKRKMAEHPTNLRYSPVADRICEMGRFGQKTGGGFYDYPNGRTPVPNADIEKLIVDTAAELGIERRDVSDEEILKRCMYPLINEGARILAEGMALRPSDIDIIYIYGYGFPPYRGGPMFWADQVGLKTVYDDILKFQAEHGDYWEPAPLLAELAQAGKSFADWGR
ncbi:MAG: 3-hydroxyacyl-CoA dehydrogenase NAD-binding domain-containing protein [Alphaproteobacteria bacterium]